MKTIDRIYTDDIGRKWTMPVEVAEQIADLKAELEQLQKDAVELARYIDEHDHLLSRLSVVYRSHIKQAVNRILYPDAANRILKGGGDE